MKKIMTGCLIILLLVIGCNRKPDIEKKDGIEEDNTVVINDEIIVSQDENLDQMVEIRIYQYFDNITNNDFVFQTVEIPGNNFLVNVINYLNANAGFRVKNIWYENTRLIVDFDQVTLNTLNSLGTAGGYQLTNEILRTFSSFPNVTEMKFLFNGAENLSSDHFSFEGIFRAGSYIRIGTGIEESDIIGLWEVEGDEHSIIYFMHYNIYREGRKESSWDGIGKWGLRGEILTITIESGAYEILENPVIVHFNISIVNEKLTLTNTDRTIHLIKSDYIQYLQ